MKEWKNKEYLKHLDYYNRDCPCMLYRGMFLVGNRGSSHSTMVQELLYNMDFTEDYLSLYEAKWNKEDKETQGISFGRKEEDCEDYCFGSILGKEIFWYVKKKDKSFVEQIRNKVKGKFINYIERNEKIIKI